MIMKKVRKRHMIIVLLVLILILSLATNPTKQEYLQFEDWGEIKPSNHVDIERVNFFIFSTYTPVVAHETGVTYLGIFGHFFQISDGQFDYPWWLEFFNGSVIM
jgi:hypothetical protein